MKKIRKMTKDTETWVLMIIIVLSLIIQARSGQFFTNNNIVDILRSIIYPSMGAICALLAFVSTGPDVSFPMIGALSSYLAIAITKNTGFDGPWFVVYLIAIFFGALMGAVNGFIIVKYKFPSLIVTLGMSSVISGILFGAFEAERTELPANLQRFGNAALFSVKNPETGLGSSMPYTFIILIVLYLIAYLVLNHTMVGRGVYAIGGDEVSAARAGFNVNAIRFGVFVVNGCIAAIAGLSYAVMTMHYLPAEYSGGEMVVIAAIVLGGARLTGGVGTLRGCLLGTLLLTMVTNSLILVGISINWQKVFVGGIIIVGTVIPMIQKHFASKKAETLKNGGNAQ
jgi:simple sugar transport system permease protein